MNGFGRFGSDGRRPESDCKAAAIDDVRSIGTVTFAVTDSEGSNARCEDDRTAMTDAWQSRGALVLQAAGMSPAAIGADGPSVFVGKPRVEAVNRSD